MSSIPSLLELVARVTEKLDDREAAAGFREPIRSGSAEGYVSIDVNPDEPDELLLMVRLAIMTVPPGPHEEFFDELLRLNHAFGGRAAFSVSDDGHVALTAGRPLTDLDPGEVLDLILWTSEQADLHDDRLLARFGQ
jgi:hypothetical protein